MERNLSDIDVLKKNQNLHTISLSARTSLAVISTTLIILNLLQEDLSASVNILMFTHLFMLISTVYIETHRHLTNIKNYKTILQNNDPLLYLSFGRKTAITNILAQTSYLLVTALLQKEIGFAEESFHFLYYLSYIQFIDSISTRLISFDTEIRSSYKPNITNTFSNFKTLQDQQMGQVTEANLTDTKGQISHVVTSGNISEIRSNNRDELPTEVTFDFETNQETTINIEVQQKA